MKIFQLLSIIALCAIIPLTSCSDSKKEDRAKEARQTLPVAPPANTTTSNSPALNPSATASTNPEPHYKCPNNDGGTGTSAGACPVCGADMTHNQAFHNQDTPPNTNNPITPPTTTPEPAQNAAGVWHYTCGSGCAGGAGSAGKCATCGGDLAHNKAYHN